MFAKWTATRIISTNDTMMSERMIDLPQEVLATYVLSFSDFQSILRLMRTNRFLYSAANEELRRREALILESGLPVECETVADASQETKVKAELRLGWSEPYAQKESLVNHALRFANPDGVSSSRYKERTARHLLSSRQACVGWACDADFPEDDHHLPLYEQSASISDEEGYVVSEPGWGVLIKHGPFTGSLTWDIFVDMLSHFEGQHPILKSKVMECTSVLLMRARPLSIIVGYMRYDHRYSTSSWSNGNEGSLMFYTSTNLQIELFVSAITRVVD
mmetsp:Transcript_27838/g.67733  ORF Transcript_27838/g.67733 Transcript_27838/m.67733 type:complete len:277 (-) Transcript_27838:582-1412(-)